MPNTKQYLDFGPGVWEERMTTEQPAVDEAIFRRRASLPANFLLERIHQLTVTLEARDRRIAELEEAVEYQGAMTKALLEAQSRYVPRIAELEAGLRRIADETYLHPDERGSRTGKWRKSSEIARDLLAGR